MNIRFTDALFALIVHGLLIGFLLVGVRCSHTVQPPGTIQGVIMPSAPPKAPPQAQTPPVPPQPVVPPKADKSAVAQEETHQNAADVAAKQKQEAEAAQRALIEQQRQQEKQQAEALAKQAQADADAKAKAQEEAKQAAEADVARKQAEEVKRKQALEVQKKADADKKAKAAAAAKAAADKKWAQEQLEGALASELQGQAQNQWGAQVVAAISKAWSYIAGSDQLHCKIKIQLSTSGEVLNATVTQTSGNKLFDDSAVTAAYKASPLPLPSDMSSFEPTLNICFSPGGSSC